jgi:hypothetical protein
MGNRDQTNTRFAQTPPCSVLDNKECIKLVTCVRATTANMEEEYVPPPPSLLESYSKSAQKGQPSQSYAETTDCMRAKPMTLQMQAWSGHVGQKWQNLSWKRTLKIR